MKKDLHPQYYTQAKVHCACGNTFTVGSTKETIETETCPACHPFWNEGDESRKKIAGRLEKFRDRQQKTVAKQGKPKKNVLESKEEVATESH